MTRRSFIGKALGCLAACVLAPVRAVEPEPIKWLESKCDSLGRTMIGSWRGRVVWIRQWHQPSPLYFSAANDPMDWYFRAAERLNGPPLPSSPSESTTRG